MSDDNILSFPGPANTNTSVKKPLPADERSKIVDEASAMAKASQLKALDDIRRLVEAGQIDSFAIVGLSPVGAILTEYCPPGAHRYDYPATFVGALAALQTELTEAVRSMPQMLNDGTIVAHSDTTVL